MQVLFDALPLQSLGARNRGIGRYAAALLTSLRAERPGWHVRALVHGYLPPPDPAALGGLPTDVFHPPLPVTGDNRRVNELYLADWVVGRRPDWVLHSAPFDNEGLIPFYGPTRPRTAGVLYDLIPVLFPDKYGTDVAGCEWYANRLREVVRSFDLLLAISAASAADARRLLGERCPAVSNIRGAADPDFRPLPPAEAAAAGAAVRAKFRLGESYILYVGGIDWRKNMDGAIAGFAAVPPAARAGCDLVLACKVEPEDRTRLLADAARLGVGRHVKVTGYVSDDDLRALYQGCRLFFFPSRYEGLGLPVLEALLYGAPVVAADNSSLPEYAGPASWYCDPDAPESMAAALAAALAVPREAGAADRAAFAASFTWADTGRRTAAAIEAVPAPEPVRVPAVPARPRVAWVSPVPPSETGIADYTADVLPALARGFELEVVVDPRAVAVAPDIARRYRVVTGDEVTARNRARAYDLFVYHVGNSSFHTYMLPLMARYPGLVVLHDVSLGWLLRHSHTAGCVPHDPTDELAAHGETHLADWARQGWLHPFALAELGPANQRVLDLAEYVVVHSGWAWDKARRATDAPVALVPMLVPDEGRRDRRAERARLGLPAAEFVVASLGLVGAPKRLPSVMKAAGKLPADLQARTRVVIVGPSSDHDRTVLRGVADRAGFAGAVEFRGRVPIEDFAAYAVAADVTVQLRYPSRGETSAALARALAAGAACVTSDQGSMAEVPNGVVLKVRSPGREVADLAAHLTRLAAHPRERDRLGAAARAYMRGAHGPAVVASKYAAALRDAVARRAAGAGARAADVATALADAWPPVPAGVAAGWGRLAARAAGPAGVEPPALRMVRPADAPPPRRPGRRRVA